MKRELTDISSIYDELDQIRVKINFMNSANVAHQEAILSGSVDLDKDFVYGQHALNLDLETAFEDALKALETFCKVAK